nr:MAG: hypothetical protein EDM05_33360 [Leptolyngbya sp. IPPAS B-1204]
MVEQHIPMVNLLVQIGILLALISLFVLGISLTMQGSGAGMLLLGVQLAIYGLGGFISLTD